MRNRVGVGVTGRHDATTRRIIRAFVVEAALEGLQPQISVAVDWRHGRLQEPPLHERYLLADRWRRTAYAAALNIAEGASRRGPREFRRFLDVARSSLHQLEAVLELVTTLGYLSEEDVKDVRQSRGDYARMVYGLLRSMEAAARRGS